MTGEEAIQKRDIIVTQFINELGVTIETNTKPLIHCKDCIHFEDGIGMIGYCCRVDRVVATDFFCAYGERMPIRSQQRR